MKTNQKKQNQTKYIVAAGVLFFVMAFFLYQFHPVQTEEKGQTLQWEEDNQAENQETDCDKANPVDNTVLPDSTKEEASQIKVYICGAVKNPGVYEVKANDRIDDLVNMAGGFLAEADCIHINLASKLMDGDKIYIMTKEEADLLEAEPSMELHSMESQKAKDADGRVNINTATAGELMTLPGIGQTKADRIISYRETKGAFGSIDEITKVDGIKTGVFETIKDLITI